MKFLVGKDGKPAKYPEDVSETDFGSELTHPNWYQKRTVQVCMYVFYGILVQPELGTTCDAA